MAANSAREKEMNSSSELSRINNLLSDEEKMSLIFIARALMTSLEERCSLLRLRMNLNCSIFGGSADQSCSISLICTLLHEIGCDNHAITIRQQIPGLLEYNNILNYTNILKSSRQKASMRGFLIRLSQSLEQDQLKNFQDQLCNKMQVNPNNFKTIFEVFSHLEQRGLIKSNQHPSQGMGIIWNILKNEEFFNVREMFEKHCDTYVQFEEEDTEDRDGVSNRKSSFNEKRGQHNFRPPLIPHSPSAASDRPPDNSPPIQPGQFPPNSAGPFPPHPTRFYSLQNDQISGSGHVEYQRSVSHDHFTTSPFSPPPPSLPPMVQSSSDGTVQPSGHHLQSYDNDSNNETRSLPSHTNMSRTTGASQHPYTTLPTGVLYTDHHHSNISSHNNTGPQSHHSSVHHPPGSYQGHPNVYQGPPNSHQYDSYQCPQQPPYSHQYPHQGPPHSHQGLQSSHNYQHQNPNNYQGGHPTYSHNMSTGLPYHQSDDRHYQQYYVSQPLPGNRDPHSNNLHSNPHPSTNHPQSSSNYPHPSTNHPQSSANYPQPSTNHPHPSTNHPQSSANYPHPSTNHPHPSTNHPHSSANYPHPSTNYYPHSNTSNTDRSYPPTSPQYHPPELPPSSHNISYSHQPPPHDRRHASVSDPPPPPTLRPRSNLRNQYSFPPDQTTPPPLSLATPTQQTTPPRQHMVFSELSRSTSSPERATVNSQLSTLPYYTEDIQREGSVGNLSYPVPGSVVTNQDHNHGNHDNGARRQLIVCPRGDFHTPLNNETSINQQANVDYNN